MSNVEIRVNEFIHLGIDLTEDQFARLSVNEQYNLIKEAEYLAKQRERNPLPFFVPNMVQEKFIKMIGSAPVTKKKIFIFSAANAVGKSSVACVLLGNLIWGRQTDWFNYPLFTEPNSFPKKIWYLSEHDAFQNKLIGEMKKWFPKKRYTFIKAGRKFDSHMESDTGWILEAKCLHPDQRVLMADIFGDPYGISKPPLRSRHPVGRNWQHCYGHFPFGVISAQV